MRAGGELPPRRETPRTSGQPWPLQAVFPIHARGDPLGQARWEQARRRPRSKVGRTINDDDVVRMLLEEFLQGGTRVVRESPYHVVIQKRPQCRHAAVDTREGPVPVDRATAATVGRGAPRIDFERGEAELAAGSDVVRRNDRGE